MDNITTVENDLRSRRFLDGNSSRTLFFGEEAMNTENAASEIFSAVQFVCTTSVLNEASVHDFYGS